VIKSRFFFIEALSNIFLDLKNGIQQETSSLNDAIQALSDLHSYIQDARI
jgi:hypothetical protein